MPEEEPRLVTASELAHMLRVSRSAVRGWISRRMIPVTRFGRSVRIKIETAEKLIREGLPPTKKGRE